MKNESPWFTAATGGPDLPIGTPVAKVGGDYTFEGWIVAVFAKRSGAVRYVVEDDRGVLHIYSGKNLAIRVERGEMA